MCEGVGYDNNSGGSGMVLFLRRVYVEAVCGASSGQDDVPSSYGTEGDHVPGWLGEAQPSGSIGAGE